MFASPLNPPNLIQQVIERGFLTSPAHETRSKIDQHSLLYGD
jgi:hypothetical protein